MSPLYNLPEAICVVELKTQVVCVNSATPVLPNCLFIDVVQAKTSFLLRYVGLANAQQGGWCCTKFKSCVFKELTCFWSLSYLIPKRILRTDVQSIFSQHLLTGNTAQRAVA